MELLKGILDDHGFMEALYRTMEHPLVLPFVNREQEVKALSMSLIMDSLKAALGITDNQAYLMPFLPQLFGAGKTTIGKCLLEQANIHKADLLQELRKINLPLLTNILEKHIETLPPDQQQQARAHEKEQMFANQLDKFLGAKYVQVSLDKLSSPTSELPSFKQALQVLIKGVLADAGIKPSNDMTVEDRNDIQHFIRAITGSREVVIHFDDVGSLLDYSKYHGYFEGMIDQNGVSIDAHPKWEMKRIYKLWNEIHLLNKMDGVYCFMSGKRSALIFLGQKLLDRDNERPESPTGSIAVILRMFTSHYIRMIADKLNLWKALGITDENLKTRLVDAIQQLTGGVPRLVSWTMKVLLHGADRLGHLFARVEPEDLKLVVRELLYNIFTHDERSNVLASSEILANPTTMGLYMRLLVLSLRGKGIDKKAAVPFMGETTEVPLIVVVSALDCYVDKEQDNMWKLVFPELVLMWVSKNCRDQRLTFVADWVLNNPDQVENGAVHEMVFQLTFETLFTRDPLATPHQTLGEVLPFLAGTKLAGWHLQMEKSGFAPVPKVTSDRRCKLDDWQRSVLIEVLSRPAAERLGALQELFDNKDDNKWAKRVSDLIPLGKRKREFGGIEQADLDTLQSFLRTTAHFDASDLIVNYLVPAGHLGCPVSKQSGWPDFYFGEHVEEEVQAKAGKHGGTKLIKQRVLLYALWWQLKLYSESSSVTWSTIKEEIAKTPHLARHNCLVVVSSHLGVEVVKAIGDSTHLLLQNGNGYGIEMPPNLEVVILGEKGLAQLYSEYDLEGLKRLAAANTFDAISKRIQQPTCSLAGVALSHTPVPGRTIKLTFVDSAMKTIVGNGMADVPFGITLSAAKTIISGVINKKVPGRTLASLEWEGVSISDDDEMQSVQHRDIVFVLLQ